MRFPDAMRSAVAPSALTVALSLAAAAPALAQQMYPGEGISVDPAASGGPQTLLTPDGHHIRTLPPLLQPGQTSPVLAPVHLHMPAKHHRRTARTEDEPDTVEPEAEVQEPEPAPVVRKPTRMTAVAPEPAAPKPAAPAKHDTATAIPFSFSAGTSIKANPAAPEPAAAPLPQTAATPAPVPQRAATPAPRKVASAEPPPQTTPVGGKTKQTEILFDEDSSTLSDSGSARVRAMASDLMNALASGADEVELIAYGGRPGDKSSSARRISLKRALAVRQSLILYGVPANRIDVRALGGVDDNGPTDRVDVFVKS